MLINTTKKQNNKPIGQKYTLTLYNKKKIVVVRKLI